ncbi:hypothetical protein [Dokdonia pacifica]|uniref:PH domain-containing protein n=1 Tax=Dokdonia pacifica TaxID=1627892 RepID=A0A239BEG5_9FLAO|nr:hypothetical protein [Dokdonia pacifica]SNS06196.1 hypothetical protein SAMN06265376_106110 [Dokdonia pacifica]
MKLKKTTLLQFLLVITSIFFLYSCDSPDTFVYLGNQMPKKYVKEVKALNLLENNEEIKYFYSDGLLDIKEGLYFVTDRKLVVYCKDWEEPKTIVPFNEIIHLDVEYDDSFLEDSYITVYTKDSIEIGFPVSSERKRDKAFFNYLMQKSQLD